jgi:exonuclease SbcC
LPIAQHSEQAKERAGEVEERLARCRTLVVELRKTLAGLPEPEEVPPAPSDAEVNALASEADRTETAARNAHGAVSVTENAVEAAKAASARAQELEGERKRVEADLSDWKRLAADLGRDGLQAAEIDCAGPELTELTNDLLHNCVGTRYSVRVETTKLDSKGKRELEGLPITAVDTENGHEGDVRGFSGGQRVLIGEALSLALTMLVARRAGLEGLTIVRDETGAALSPENSRAYVDMLRRAAAIVGADKVLLVSHNPDVWEMADSRIEVRDGGIHIH